MNHAKSYIYRNVADRFHYSKQERTNVAEHEIGHALGLQHNVGKGSVMYYATRNQSISKPDVNGLKQSYVKINIRNEIIHSGEWIFFSI